jgi:NhaP-type Na+/H+ or K+/H+ antiporter
MRIAIAATLSGQFYFAQAAGTFLWVAVLGLLIGAALSLLYHQIHRRLLVGSSDAVVQTVLLGLLPFAAFAIAEEAGASGILAAVAAGITASRLSLLEQAHFSARIMTGVTWDVTSFCLNGIIFVLLGMQLPGIVGAGPDGIDLLTSSETREIAADVLILWVVLIGLRFLWVIAPVAIRRILRRPANSGGWRVILASSLAGVRGAVTLAGALSIPLHLPSGAPFPYRELAITIAVGIIIVSMLVAAVALPLLLRGVVDDHREKSAEETVRARRAAAEAAIAALSRSAGVHGMALSASYRLRLSEIERGETVAEDNAWRDVHQSALHAERRAVQTLRIQDEIDDITARQLLSELDFVEAALMQRPSRHPTLEADR